METTFGSLQILALGWFFAALLMMVLWLLQRRSKDASAVDPGWAASIGLLAVFFAAIGPGDPSRRILIGFLAGFWAFRLTGYLLGNRILGKGREEDPRYQTLRARWGDRAMPYFFMFYQAQALLAVALSAPFLLISFNPVPALHPIEALAVVVWGIAIVGETVADRQLAAFRADPANQGRTCRAGLWRYSRHPNYFFEWLNWCAYGLMAVAAPWGWLGLASPLVMLYLILRVTGIPPTEERALASRGDDYRDYQRTTSAFIPWFPKRGRS